LHVGYSPFHFIRAFRAAYGETPAQDLRRRRIERARDLLGAANLTVREVAELVGLGGRHGLGRGARSARSRPAGRP
jgi:AraC-like DNA-binding protein